MTEFTLGQQVKVKGHSGIVRFFGETKFAPGEWVGIELDAPQGRNNGTVQGVKYFDCKNSGDYGIFVRPALLDDSILNSNSSHITHVVNKLQSKLKTAMDDINKYRTTVTDLETEIAKYKLLVEDLEASLEKSAINEEHLQSINEVLVNDLESLKSKLEKLQREHSLLREELDLHKDLEEAIKAQELDDAISKEDFTILVSNNKRLEVALSSMKKSSAETEAKLKSQVAQLEEQLSKNSVAKNSMESLQEKLLASENVAQSLQEQLENVADSDRIIEHLTIENEELQNTVKELTQSVKEFSELNQLENSIGDSQFEVEGRLKQEIDALVKEVHQNKSEILRLSSINEKITEESITAHQNLLEIKKNYRENEMEVMRLQVRKSEAKIMGLKLTNSFLEAYSNAVIRLQEQLMNDDFKLLLEKILKMKMITSHCSVIIEHLSGLKSSSSILRSTLLLRRFNCAVLFLSQLMTRDTKGDIDSIQLDECITRAAQDIKAIMKKCQDGDFEDLDLGFVSPFIKNANEMLPRSKVADLDYVITKISSLKEELKSCNLSLSLVQTQCTRSPGATGPKQIVRKDVFDAINSLNTILRLALTKLEASVFNLTSEVDFDLRYFSALNDRLIELLQTCENDPNSGSFSMTTISEDFKINFDELESHIQDTSSRVASELHFNKEKLESIFLPDLENKPKRINSKEETSILHSKILEKESELKDLAMQLELLEKNSSLSLKAKQDELDAAYVLNSKLKMELEGLGKDYEEQVSEKSALVAESNTFGKKTPDATFIQVPALQSIHEKRKYVSEMVIVDEISLLREMVNSSTLTRDNEDYDWLEKPLIRRLSHEREATHTFLQLANQKRKESVALMKQNFSLRPRC